MAKAKPQTAKKKPAKASTKTTTTKSKAKPKATAKAKPKAKAKSKATAAGDEEVTVDRRAPKDERRTDSTRRTEETGHVAEEQRTEEQPRRKKVARRRQIDPTTCERDYNNDEIEFMHAMDEYKRAAGRMFPTCSEILEVMHGLGYRRLNPEELAILNPPSPIAATGELGGFGGIDQEADTAALVGSLDADLAPFRATDPSPAYDGAQTLVAPDGDDDLGLENEFADA